jgi:hypothetical protein
VLGNAQRSDLGWWRSGVGDVAAGVEIFALAAETGGPVGCGHGHLVGEMVVLVRVVGCSDGFSSAVVMMVRIDGGEEGIGLWR